MNCKNCNTEFNSNYCPNCGQPKALKRIDGQYIVHEIEHVLHFERGILYTVRELLLHPGQNIRTYLSENRSRLVKPIIFVIICSLIYTVLSHFFHFENNYAGQDAQKSVTGAMMKWVQDHYGYANILMSVFIAWWLRVFFRKYDYNFYEVIIMLCFVVGMGMLIFSVFVLLQGVIQTRLINVSSIIVLMYCAWAIGDFFDRKKVASYVKAFIAYLLGMVSFWTVLVVVGLAIDALKKH